MKRLYSNVKTKMSESLLTVCCADFLADDAASHIQFGDGLWLTASLQETDIRLPICSDLVDLFWINLKREREKIEINFASYVANLPVS